jgi:hypothetical protein
VNLYGRAACALWSCNRLSYDLFYVMRLGWSDPPVTEFSFTFLTRAAIL